MEPDYSKVPAQLTACNNFVCGDKDKVPYDPKKPNKKALADKPGTWGTFDQALSYLKAHKNNGIRTLGFEMGESPFTGIDIDHCRDPETGEIEPWAFDIIKISDTYAEISPSGTGIRIITNGGDDFPAVNRKKGGLGESGKGAIEIANTGKYFSITGNHLEGTPNWIGHRPEELKKVFDMYFPEKAGEEKPPVKSDITLEDSDILQRAGIAKNGEAFKKLYSGDWSDYPSQSEAEMALCCMLAFWCGNNAEQINRIFRQSGLMRDKWNREDYRTQTIQRAIDTTQKNYQGPKKETETIKEEGVIDSTKGKNKETQSEQIVDFLEHNRGERFKASEIGKDLGLTGGVYMVLQRLYDSGAIFKEGKSYYLPAEAKNCDPFEIAANAFNIEFPLEIGIYARVSQGDVVLVAGTKNSGKSAFLGETAILNMHRQEINYIVTENMRKIAERYIKWGYCREEIMKHMMFKDARDRRYDSVIDPNCINILDYYNPSDGDYTKVAKEIEMMAKRLETGILVLGIQKKKGAEFARGNELSEELSQLSIHLHDEDKIGEERMGRAKLRMIKEEGQIKGGTGKNVQYTFTSYDTGSRMVQIGYWGWGK